MPEQIDNLELATALTVAWLSNPHTRASTDEVPLFLRSMHDAVANLTSPAPEPEAAEPAEEHTPAVSVRKSLSSPDHIISLIDGKPYRTLRRHLATNGLTPEQYRERFKLKADYPMVASTYSEARRAMAKSIGLGRKAGHKVEAAAEAVAKKTRRSGKAALDAAKKALGSS